jgi:succinyl-CoA synthetase beta subunit
MVARGVVGAAQNLGLSLPVVVRLEGTNVEEGQRVIRESGLNFTVAKGMQDAAEKVVGLAKQAGSINQLWIADCGLRIESNCLRLLIRNRIG